MVDSLCYERVFTSVFVSMRELVSMSVCSLWYRWLIAWAGCGRRGGCR